MTEFLKLSYIYQDLNNEEVLEWLNEYNVKSVCDFFVKQAPFDGKIK